MGRDKPRELKSLVYPKRSEEVGKNMGSHDHESWRTGHIVTFHY